MSNKMSLRKKALEEVEQANAEITLQTRIFFKDMFGEEPECVKGKVVYHEGLKFVRQHTYQKHRIDSFEVQVTCPKCGIISDMGSVTSTFTLGKAIGVFVKQHVCVEPPNPPEGSTCEQKVKHIYNCILREKKHSNNFMENATSERTKNYYLSSRRAYKTMKYWFLEQFPFCRTESPD